MTVKIRVRERREGQNVTYAINKPISLGSVMTREPVTVEARDARGEPFERYEPGASRCMWLVSPAVVEERVSVLRQRIIDAQVGRTGQSLRAQAMEMPDDSEIREKVMDEMGWTLNADVSEGLARILVDERGWCERAPGRPKKESVAA